jgi:hypothetical protein
MLMRAYGIPRDKLTGIVVVMSMKRGEKNSIEPVTRSALRADKMHSTGIILTYVFVHTLYPHDASLLSAFSAYPLESWALEERLYKTTAAPVPLTWLDGAWTTPRPGGQLAVLASSLPVAKKFKEAHGEVTQWVRFTRAGPLFSKI